MGGNGSRFTPSDDYTIKGTIYNSDYQEFMHQNAKNQEFKDYYKKNHTIRPLYEQAQEVRFKELQRSAKEMDLDEAISVIRDEVGQSALHGWFVEADSDYKPRIFNAIMNSAKVLNASWTIAYHNYVNQMENEHKKPLPFKRWLNTPMRMYRGHNGQTRQSNERFVSYSTKREISEKFGNQMSEVRIKPIDTFGSYQTTGENEFLIPVNRLKR